MIKGMIYQCNLFSQFLCQFIERGYNKMVERYGGEPIDIVAYWGIGNIDRSEPDGIPVKDIGEIKEMVANGEVEVLIIPSENYIWQQDFLTSFFAIGIGLDNIYIADRLDKDFNTGEAIIDAFTPYYCCRKLPYLEFHIADHCNLKCADCEHYSGLVEKEVFPDFIKFTRDIRQLKKFFDEVFVFRILGGEPLLNHQIEDYIRLINEVYPDSIIHIVTNALLLEKMPESFFETIKKCPEGSGISISYYPVMKNRMKDVIKFLETKDIRYEVSDEIKMFRRQQKMERSDDKEVRKKFDHCYQKGCVNLYDGKLAACFLPFTTKYFNRYFNKSLPEDGAVDLYEEGLTTEKIRRCLSSPFERCRYCMEPIEAPWHTIHNPSILEDWVDV